MSSNRVEGLCAPTVPSVQRKVKGAIFKSNSGILEERYYLGRWCGGTSEKSIAHVYTCADIRKFQIQNPRWASKEDGKWILVYE